MMNFPRAPSYTAWPAVISSCAAAAARGIARAQIVKRNETGGTGAQATPDIEMMERILPQKNRGLLLNWQKRNDPSKEEPFTDHAT